MCLSCTCIKIQVLDCRLFALRNSFKQFDVDSCLIFHDTFTFAISIYVIPYVNIVIDTPHSIIMQRKTKNINTDVFSVLLWSLKYNYKEQLCKLGEGRLLQPKRKSENYSKFQFLCILGLFFGFSILQPISFSYFLASQEFRKLYNYKQISN